MDGIKIKSFNNYEEKHNFNPRKGSNKFVWDTRAESAEVLDGMIFWWASFNASKLVPGKYQVGLSKNGKEKRETFEILIDPRSEIDLEDIQLQFDFVNAINKTVDKAHKAIKNIRQINKKLKEFESNYNHKIKVKELTEKSKFLREKLSNVEKELYQTKNRSNQDPLNFPIKLTNKLAHLVSLVTLSDFRPTDQDQAVKKELTSLIDNELKKYYKLINEELPKFNKEFAALELDYLKLN
tara:strand:- start:31659 stop:32375 length:717 start_codon:yes stop_codon:yes gene_type:complete